MNRSLAGSVVYYGALIMCLPIFAARNDPFPVGYSMGNFGTILQGNRLSGRQPWIPACFAQDSVLFSLSSVYVNYYDAMDNFVDEDFRQASVGLLVQGRRIRFKSAGTFFNALGVYEEQNGFFSIGTTVGPFVNVSAEIEAWRIGLVDVADETETIVTAGCALWIPWSFASASVRCQNITLEQAAGPGFDQPFTFSVGMHTMPHRFGAQGVVVTIQPDNHNDVRLCMGEELCIHRMVGLCAAVCSKPLMVSFGITWNLASYGLYGAFVHHPVLGWSQGIGMEYLHKK